MPETVLKCWKLKHAPTDLRRLIPQADGGWLVFMPAGGADDVIEFLVNRWTASGFSVVRFDMEGGGIVLAIEAKI